jgi:hypothetical protein
MNSEPSAQRPLTPEQAAGLKAVIRAKSAEEMLFNQRPAWH